MIKPGRPSPPRPEDVCAEAFCEYPSYAKLRITMEASCEDNELDYPTRHRQIRQSSGIPAVHSPRDRPTLRTRALFVEGPNRQQHTFLILRGAHHNEPGRDEGRWLQTAHSVDSPCETNATGASTSSKLSQSQFSTPKHNVARVLAADPYSGAAFVFRGKRGDYVKILTWGGSGLCLFAKRLETGKFVWPPICPPRSTPARTKATRSRAATRKRAKKRPKAAK